MKSTKIIFSTNLGSKDLALNEFKKLYKNSNFIKWINEETGIIKIDDSFQSISQNIKENNLIFIRHIQPVNIEILNTNSNKDLYTILGNIKKIKSLLDHDLTFSIQTKISNSNQAGYVKKDIYEIVKNEIIKDGFVESTKTPSQVVSIFVAEDNIYIGVSKTSENLSKWTSGEARFSADNMICRSESKLLEIFENFDLDKYKITVAIDLGCSPGGWSRLLLEKGYKVIGIDPAIVDEKVLKNKNFTHFNSTSENFVQQNKERFDLIVNDMKMDFIQSIRIVDSLKPFLNKDGIIIMTIKLFKTDMGKINDIMARLRSDYNILFARQFYNDRNEFSVVLKPKVSCETKIQE